MIYSALTLPTGGNHVLMRAYGVISGASTRREMIQAACDAYFLLHPHDELMAETRHLLNLYGHASSRRNEIAHAVVSATLRSRTVNKVAVPLPREWFLGPPIFATRKNDKLSFETNGTIVTGPKYRYSTVEIDHFSKCFAELEVRAANLSQRIRAFHASLPQKSD